ncbi:hypothetical protein NDU88_006503 [Pleurodeles waltl]|uniref:Uncharacterized protein n=1 Tax=Pleurodeles waltl TaxID=8319 RepID=A0AAV7LPC4_PLEWA|nr:hypothetical protein NDU88_006503 [Pleurodeles waltl]
MDWPEGKPDFPGPIETGLGLDLKVAAPTEAGGKERVDCQCREPDRGWTVRLGRPWPVGGTRSGEDCAAWLLTGPGRGCAPSCFGRHVWHGAKRATQLRVRRLGFAQGAGVDRVPWSGRLARWWRA